MSIFLVSPSIPCKRSNKQFIILKHKTFLDTPSKFFDRMGFIGWRVLNDSPLSDSLVRWPQSDNLSNNSLQTVLVVVVYIINGDDGNIISECEIPFLYSRINGYWMLIQYCDQIQACFTAISTSTLFLPPTYHHQNTAVIHNHCGGSNKCTRHFQHPVPWQKSQMHAQSFCLRGNIRQSLFCLAQEMTNTCYLSKQEQHDWFKLVSRYPIVYIPNIFWMSSTPLTIWVFSDLSSNNFDTVSVRFMCLFHKQKNT